MKSLATFISLSLSRFSFSLTVQSMSIREEKHQSVSPDFDVAFQRELLLSGGTRSRNSRVVLEKNPLTFRKLIPDGWHERHVLAVEERPDQVAAGDELGAVVGGRRLRVQRSRVHRLAGTVTTQEEDRGERDGPRYYFHFGKMAPNGNNV